MILIACGSCGDVVVAKALPFVFYWTLLFAIWAAGWGLINAILSLHAGVRPGLRPLVYLAAAVAFVVVASPFTGGSLLAPMALFLPVWIYRLWMAPLLQYPPRSKSKAIHRLEASIERVRRITLALAWLLVPLAYVRQYVQRNPEVVPFREWLIVSEPVAAVGAVVFGWAVLVGVWQTRRRTKRQQASAALFSAPTRAR